MIESVFGKILNYLQRQRVRSYMRKMHVGLRVNIRSGLVVAKPKNITIENDVRINANCVLQAHAPIHIGRHTMIGANCSIVTANHDISKREQDAFEALNAAPVTIGNNCWLGVGVIVLPGVSIGDEVVVGAGSIVTRDLPAGTVCFGSPAKVKRKRDSAD